MIEWYTFLACLVAATLGIALGVVLKFGWAWGAASLLVCIGISMGMAVQYWTTHENEILRDKVNITDLREELNSRDVFYNASSTPTT